MALSVAASSISESTLSGGAAPELFAAAYDDDFALQVNPSTALDFASFFLLLTAFVFLESLVAYFSDRDES